MIYSNTVRGKFISRPNRFIAEAEIGGEIKTVHVKNTGRCRELLVNGADIICEKSLNPQRKTEYDLVSVYKGQRLVNIDSQAANTIAYEYLPELFDNITYVKPEYTFGDSRFDFYIEADGERIFLEVKGCTLEKDNTAMFPDAPTQRGIKHLNGLVRCAQLGYKAYILFIIQMKDVDCFTPNRITHPQFGEALDNAEKNGVKIIAVDCNVSENEVTAADRVEVRL